jgi:hypothetical protein
MLNVIHLERRPFRPPNLPSWPGVPSTPAARQCRDGSNARGGSAVPQRNGLESGWTSGTSTRAAETTSDPPIQARG